MSTNPGRPNVQLQQATASSSTWSNFARWGGAFGVYAVVMVSLADTADYEDVAVTFAWLVAIGAFYYWFNLADQNLASMINIGATHT